MTVERIRSIKADSIESAHPFDKRDLIVTSPAAMTPASASESESLSAFLLPLRDNFCRDVDNYHGKQCEATVCTTVAE